MNEWSLSGTADPGSISQVRHNSFRLLDTKQDRPNPTVNVCHPACG